MESGPLFCNWTQWKEMWARSGEIRQVLVSKHGSRWAYPREGSFTPGLPYRDRRVIAGLPYRLYAFWVIGRKNLRGYGNPTLGGLIGGRWTLTVLRGCRHCSLECFIGTILHCPFHICASLLYSAAPGPVL